MSKEQITPVTAWAVYTPEDNCHIDTIRDRETNAWATAGWLADDSWRSLVEAGYTCEEVVILKKSQYDQQQARIEELEKANRWIRVEEGLPEENVGVLVFIPEEDMHTTSGMWDVSQKWVLLDEYRTPDCPVTHWKPLGDIPEAYHSKRDENNKIMEFLKRNLDLPSVEGKEENK